MRRFYSLLLTAAFLLVGINVWAAENQVQVVNHTHPAQSGTYSSLQEAIDHVLPGDTADLTLLGDQVLTNIVQIPHFTGDTANWNYQGEDPNVQIGEKPIRERLAQRIRLDLNHNTIKEKEDLSAAIGCIALMKGTLNITGSGEIRHNHAGGSGNLQKSVITLYGAPWAFKQTFWTTLYIDKDVFINSNGTGKNYGICIQNTSGNKPSMMDKAGYITYTTKDKVSGYNLDCHATESYAGCAFGVRAFIHGQVYGNHRGINVLGTINANPKCDEPSGTDAWYSGDKKYRRYPNPATANKPFYYEYYYPYIQIFPEAQVWCYNDDLESGNGGIYGGGYCVYDISGTVHGQTGIFLKSGDAILDGATVTSDSDNKQKGGNYGDSNSGTAIFIASDAGYAGDVKVILTAETTVNGGGEAAIVDMNASNKALTETNVTHLEIQQGVTINAGGEGAIEFTSESGKKTTVTGGTINGTLSVGGSEKAVSTLVPNEGYHVTTIQDGDEVISVISEGNPPSEEEGNSVIGAAENASISWKNSATKEETLTANKKLTELVINQNYAQTLTVADGATLEVGRVVLGAKAQIIVEAGGTFLINGQQGIATVSESNILLKTQEGKPSIFLLDPAITYNRHPKATVELISKSYYENGKTVYQRFGLPTFDAGAVLKYKNLPSTVNTYIAAWDYANDAWASGWTQVPATEEGLTIASAIKPFHCIDLASNNVKADKMTYLFEGTLVGNNDGAMVFNAGFNPYANSYMAPIDIETLLNRLATNYPELEASINVYQALSNDNYTWKGIGQADFGEFDPLPGLITEVAPMQAYVLRLRSGNTYNATVSYKDNVYDPYMASLSAAPARSQARKHNFITMSIANANGVADYARIIEDARFSNEFDNGYDITKYMNSDINLYVKEEEAMSTMASDDILNTYIGVSVAEAGVYTLKVEHNGLEYALVDTENNNVIELVAGNTYEFFQQAGKNDARFQVVKVNRMPTALENVDGKAVCTKFVKDGVMYIFKNGAVYNVQGQIVK